MKFFFKVQNTTHLININSIKYETHYISISFAYQFSPLSISEQSLLFIDRWTEFGGCGNQLHISTGLKLRRESVRLSIKSNLQLK